MLIRPIALEDVLNYNKDALFKQFGMDPNGNNEVGAWARRIAQPLGYLTADRLSYLQSLEPQRQAAITEAVKETAPENMFAAAAARRARDSAGATDRGLADAAKLRSMGLGAGAQAGALINQQNMSTQSGNDYLNYISSPEGRTAMAKARMDLISGAQDIGLGPLLQAGGFIEGRHQANEAEQQAGGIGSILGTLGGLAGTASGLGLGRPRRGGSSGGGYLGIVDQDSGTTNSGGWA